MVLSKIGIDIQPFLLKSNKTTKGPLICFIIANSLLPAIFQRENLLSILTNWQPNSVRSSLHSLKILKKYHLFLLQKFCYQFPLKGKFFLFILLMLINHEESKTTSVFLQQATGLSIAESQYSKHENELYIPI